MIRRQLRRCLARALGLALAAPMAHALGQELIAAPRPRRLPPPSAALLRSLQGFQDDLERLDRSLLPAAPEAAGAEEPDGSDPGPPDPALMAPAATALPLAPEAVRIERRQRLSLAQALAVAVRNDPDLAAAVLGVREQQDLAGSARGRRWPELGLNLAGGFSQQRSYNQVWTDNAGLYPAGSPFLVRNQGWNVVQSNVGAAAARVELAWELLSPYRAAAIAEADDSLKASRQRYADRLRQLQLDVSIAYYGLQLADQLLRIRRAVVESDTVVRDQVAALQQVGLVPRLDRLRAEAALQQSRYRFEQAEALQLSRQRQLSNLINVPFDVSLRASDAVRLQPPWPLDLEQTIVRGWRDNPQLRALQAARDALLRQADRRAAELLPSLRLVATGGYGQGLTTQPVIELEGCCSSALIPQLLNQRSDWAAGLQLHWRFFDGGVTAGAVAASRSAAARTDQQLARERNAIRQRLEAAFYDHRAALRQIVAARASYSASREAFRDVRARYQLGLADYSDVADTVATLTGAMEGVAESTTLANVSYAQLLRELLPVPDRPDQPVALPLVLGGS
ncbi:TolC family protein [Cyanobium gracile]|uniref:Outer membrane protein n=1 Tax=Cyanobium gracile (strain ATCC 27147 / PCC 6307) TaxID=292564 RepID=K9PAB5_CYAGP|nr:TolC family protein [Cyanobium gracile]AFY29873.1 outer membrane protein [Cyanobium gracile PCC 6307]